MSANNHQLRPTLPMLKVALQHCLGQVVIFVENVLWFKVDVMIQYGNRRGKHG